MPLTATQFMLLIPVEIGDFGVVTPQLADLWRKNDARSPIWLQYLYTKRDAISMLMGAVWEDVNVRMLTRSGIDAAAKFSHLESMLASVNREITEYVFSEVEPVVSQMAATAPTEGNMGFPDPNDPTYRGDPVRAQMFPRFP